ncbi:hypothetical protein ILUMI_13278, partial [Ignelater luminosus]
KNFYKTGGGTYVPRSSILDEKIVCTLGAQFQPLTNNFDSSADYPSETFFTTGTGAKSTSTPQKSVQEESNCSFLANGMYMLLYLVGIHYCYKIIGIVVNI